MYLLARRVFADRMTGLIAAGSLLLSVPFLLHVRQCRYYSLALFASIWILYFFFTLPVRRRLAAAGLALALTVLVHASHLLFMGAVVGLGARPSRRQVRSRGPAVVRRVARRRARRECSVAHRD